MRTHSHRRSWAFVARLVAVLALLGVIWVGCIDNTDKLTSPGKDGNDITVLSLANPRIQAVAAVQDRHTDELMSASPAVVGTATGVDQNGQPVILVLTAGPSKAGVIPQSIEGVPVVEEVTGVIHAMSLPRHADIAAAHTAKQTPPIQLGTSGGWAYDLANGYCCGGTLGSLIKKGTVQYILSNYHVFESDIVSGGNGRVAKTGDPVIQPGLIDVACNRTSAQTVGTLVVSKSLPNSNVDASIAQVVSGMVRTDGAILEIGTIGATTVAAYINQPVKKSGRTTGLTRSKVSGLNATVSVVYDNECAGGTAFTKKFTGQIVISNSGSRFLNSGDSGSLMVEDVTTKPRAVGLLFAGSSTSAIANPIGQVLSFFGASMVGQ